MNVVSFLSGIYMATFAASGIVFLKFYRHSKDSFFLFFCLSCFLMALERVVLLFFDDAFAAYSTEQTESHSGVYLIRLIAFFMILMAVIQKNRQKI